MADLNAALIAFAGVLVGGYLNNFLAEDYKRFRDGQALAGALAGELESHGEHIPDITKNLPKLKERLDAGIWVVLPEWPVPSSPVFEANTDKIGLLDPDHAKEVAYVYEQIRAFRGTFHLFTKHNTTMGFDWQAAMVQGSIDAIERAEKRGEPLIKGLKAHAKASYWKQPATIRKCVIAALVLAVLVWAFIHYASAGANEPSTNCTTVFDHAKGVLTTVCK
ncbi:hypothetical protein PQR53_20310 [Paraburkholderia fungorum]|uniref:hypothetical protein n=1 Tax=Paraburkholderia fungorum TaxID=134537 RepID=UPI0038BDB54D